MKGYLQQERKLNKTKVAPQNRPDIIFFSALDLIPLTFDRQNVFEWICNSGWIEGMAIKKLGDAYPFLDDYIQDLFLLIYDKLDRLIEVYEERGICAFCGYIQIMVSTQCTIGAKTATSKKYVDYHANEIVLPDEAWNELVQEYDGESDRPYYHQKQMYEYD